MKKFIFNITTVPSEGVARGAIIDHARSTHISGNISSRSYRKSLYEICKYGGGEYMKIFHPDAAPKKNHEFIVPADMSDRFVKYICPYILGRHILIVKAIYNSLSNAPFFSCPRERRELNVKAPIQMFYDRDKT